MTTKFEKQVKFCGDVERRRREDSTAGVFFFPGFKTKFLMSERKKERPLFFFFPFGRRRRRRRKLNNGAIRRSVSPLPGSPTTKQLLGFFQKEPYRIYVYIERDSHGRLRHRKTDHFHLFLRCLYVCFARLASSDFSQAPVHYYYYYFSGFSPNDRVRFFFARSPK